MHPSSHCNMSAWPLTRPKGEMSTRHVRVKLMESSTKGGSALLHKQKEEEQSRPIRLHAKLTAFPASVSKQAASLDWVSNVGWWIRQDYPTVRLRMPHVSNYTNLKGHLSATVTGRSRTQIRKRAFAYLSRDPNSTCRLRRSVRVKRADSLYW